MACGETTSTVQCPQCKETIHFQVTARHLSKTEVTISIDSAPIRDHIASHEAHLAMTLPPTTR